mmetsp:Transcript_97420/g.275521  ORF Transcript_97420/g.275521 Transcript_97420/m.275521 type:complete len:564 (-) Transcript_97420:99-1790(-)
MASSGPPLPVIRRLRICLLGENTAVQGVGKGDVAAALLRGFTADWPNASDPIFEFAFNFGLFERAWSKLLEEPSDGTHSGDRWGLGPLGAWFGGRIHFDQRDAGKVSPPYDPDPPDVCASLCAGSPEKLNLGPSTRAFRDVLVAAGQDVDVLEGVHRELYWESTKRPRELVRLDRSCAGILAAFARFSPEVGDFAGCGAATLDIFEPTLCPCGNEANAAMLYMAAPNGRVHKDLSAGSFLCALQNAGSNAARMVREYNRLVATTCGGEVVYDLQPGNLVRLHSLSAASGLNGQEGICEEWDADKGRWKVRMRKGFEVKAVKPENLSELPEWRKTDLRAQLEFHLTDRNLRKEWKPGNVQVFENMYATDMDGWIELNRIRSYHKALSIESSTQTELLEALKSSKCVESRVDEKGAAFVRHVRSLVQPAKRIRLDDEVAANKTPPPSVSVPPPTGPKVVPPPERKLNVPCRDLAMNGFCNKGSKCNYLHDQAHQQPWAPAAPVPPPTASQFFRGAPVQLVNLLKKPGFNGRRGKCEIFDSEAGRWQVRLGDGTQLALKEANLKLC